MSIRVHPWLKQAGWILPAVLVALAILVHALGPVQVTVSHHLDITVTTTP